MVLVDAGRPPPPGLDSHAHAGTLSFELYHGKERVIVNCGAQPAEGEWLLAQRSTAAHSTIAVDDTNSSALMPDGHGLARPPSEVIARREEAEGNLWLETSHDGYLPNYGLLHHRRLYLSADGADLRGHDRLEGSGGKGFTLRFHLHPSVNASLAQDKQAVLLRLPSGAGFRLRSQVVASPGIAETGEVALGESIYLGRRRRAPAQPAGHRHRRADGRRRRDQMAALAGEPAEVAAPGHRPYLIRRKPNPGPRRACRSPLDPGFRRGDGRESRRPASTSAPCAARRRGG